MINRELFNDDHEPFRRTVRRFIEKEIAPHHEQWEIDGVVPRDLWLKAGAARDFSGDPLSLVAAIQEKGRQHLGRLRQSRRSG